MLGRYMISRRDRVGDWERAQIAGARFAVTTSESDCEETACSDPAVVASRDAPRRCRSTESQSLALSVDEV